MHLGEASGADIPVARDIQCGAELTEGCRYRWAKKNVLVYIFICSLLGGLSVACTSGLGAAILKSIRDKDGSQWKHWFMYFLIGLWAGPKTLKLQS